MMTTALLRRTAHLVKNVPDGSSIGQASQDGRRTIRLCSSSLCLTFKTRTNRQFALPVGEHLLFISHGFKITHNQISMKRLPGALPPCPRGSDSRAAKPRKV